MKNRVRKFRFYRDRKIVRSFDEPLDTHVFFHKGERVYIRNKLHEITKVKEAYPDRVEITVRKIK